MSIVSPITQLTSRGLRKAPVKKIAQQVHDDRRDEDERGPVVGLAQQQPGRDVVARGATADA